MEDSQQREKEKNQLGDLPEESTEERTRRWLEENSGKSTRGEEGEVQKERETKRPPEDIEEGRKRETGRKGRPSKAESLRRERKTSASSTSTSLSTWLRKRGRESDSDGSEIEREKRKKVGEKITSEKEKMDMDKIMENMTARIVKSMEDKFKKSQEEMFRKLEEIKEEMKKHMDTEVERIRADFQRRDEERNQEICALRKEVAEMKIKEEERERREKKRNIVIWGARGQDGEARQAAVRVFRKINNEFEEAGIRDAMYIGRNENRGIVVELEKFEDKKKLMVGKSKLKGETIYLDDDLTKKEREMQKNIREWAKNLRTRGKRVNVGYGKGYVDGKEFKWNPERRVMEDRTFRGERME